MNKASSEGGVLPWRYRPAKSFNIQKIDHSRAACGNGCAAQHYRDFRTQPFLPAKDTLLARYSPSSSYLLFIFFTFFRNHRVAREEKRFYSPDSVPPALANKHTTFILAHAQGRVLADGVTFRHGEPNGGGWFWWWNWRAFACMLLALVLVGVGTLGTMVRDGRGCNCTLLLLLLLCSLFLSRARMCIDRSSRPIPPCRRINSTCRRNHCGSRAMPRYLLTCTNTSGTTSCTRPLLVSRSRRWC